MEVDGDGAERAAASGLCSLGRAKSPEREDQQRPIRPKDPRPELRSWGPPPARHRAPSPRRQRSPEREPALSPGYPFQPPSPRAPDLFEPSSPGLRPRNAVVPRPSRRNLEPSLSFPSGPNPSLNRNPNSKPPPLSPQRRPPSPGSQAPAGKYYGALASGASRSSGGRHSPISKRPRSSWAMNPDYARAKAEESALRKQCRREGARAEYAAAQADDIMCMALGLERAPGRAGGRGRRLIRALSSLQRALAGVQWDLVKGARRSQMSYRTIREIATGSLSAPLMDVMGLLESDGREDEDAVVEVEEAANGEIRAPDLARRENPETSPRRSSTVSNDHEKQNAATVADEAYHSDVEFVPDSRGENRNVARD